MSPTEHPSDIELFEYAEGELPEADASRVRLHVEACATCADDLAAAARGRETLREAPLLAAPERARVPASSLGPQESDNARTSWSRRRLIAVLAPVAAVAVAVVAIVVVTGRNGGETSAQKVTAEAQAAATTAAAQTAAAADAAGAATPATTTPGGGAESAPSLESTAAPVLVRKVAGPVKAVVDLLAGAGLDAAPTGDGGVTVTGSDAAAVDRALDGRATGPVAVSVLPAANQP